MSTRDHPSIPEGFDIEAWQRADRPCPECGCPVLWDFTYYTYGGDANGKGWMSCLPCDSAVHLFSVCRVADHPTHRCGWDHT